MANWEDVKQALENPSYKWRTVRGISKELNVSQEIIEEFLTKNADKIVNASAPASTGEELYTTREHYRKTASLLDRVASTLTQSVSGSLSSSSTSSSSSRSSSSHANQSSIDDNDKEQIK